MSVRSPIEEMRKEHQALLNDAKELEATVRGLEAGTGESWDRVGGSLPERLEMFHRGLLLHFRREEEGLFPDARRMVSERARRADVVGQFFAEEAEDDVSAHAVLAARTQETAALVAQIEQAGSLDQRSLARLRTLVNLTRGLLERHAEKEDKLIFPMIQRSLDPAQLEQVNQRLQALGSAADLTDAGMRGDEDLKGLGADRE